MAAFSFQTLQNKFDQLRSNKVFELLVIGVIIVSALIIGVKTFEVPDWFNSALNILDWAITLFFLTEITIRFIGEPRKRDFFKNGWNLFDTLVVTLSLIPIGHQDMALIARLVRVFRVLRMVSIIPELRTLINSLLKALPQLGYVLLMMFVIFYIYAAVGTTLFGAINPTLWGDIAISLLTLFRVMTFEDWTDVMYETMAVHGWSWMYYLSFICLTAFAFLNMVIGIVVNVIENENKAEEAKLHEGEPTLIDIHAELKALRAEIKTLKQ
ncbi:ion transporter [Echinimonas agarilytica]|uniref:Ion transporter n=1 Tax=Echinimonas agarilytica TaxID=1215918 RepID=A0AA41W3Z4_9GAMM|nr:ion transporter [Echinimonas agarilytica]MCM2678275.1 ion transporter [Echinimonas agarilytica]